MWKYKITFTIAICSICWISNIAARLAAEIPSDHLLPPPAASEFLPTPQRLKHAKSAIDGYHSPFNHESPSNQHGITANKHQEPSSIMTRVARWFGFTDSKESQAFTESAHQKSRWKDDSLQYAQKGDNTKTFCYLCNNYPWVPMLPFSAVPQSIEHHWADSLQHPANQPADPLQPIPYQSQQQQGHPDHQQLNRGNQLYQREVKFNFQLPTTILQPAQPHVASTLWSSQHQNLPFTSTATHFSENVGAHSELQTNQVRPKDISTEATEVVYNPNHTSTTIPADPGFEIIKSEQITHFVSSVEYPAEYEQSQAIDVPFNHRIRENNAPQLAVNLNANTAEYQHSILDANLDQRTPASQILTDIGSFGIRVKEDQAVRPELSGYSTHRPLEMTVAGDSYPAASVHEPLERNTSVWKTFENETGQGVTAEITATIKPSSTPTPSVLIERHRIVALDQSPLRETPKHLLSSPLQHINLLASGPPRPFTRDPSDLNYRLGSITTQPLPHKPLLLKNDDRTTVEELIPPAPLVISSLPPQNVIDAAGQFANMSPPAPPPNTNKDTQQIIIPYTTMNRPRPFEPQWSHTIANHVDPYLQEESKLVEATAKATKPPQRPVKQSSNKYLTKILASNLRELLRREHEKKQMQQHGSPGKTVNLQQLQQNIDDWTEQEFTSLSHRPSTPTIHGRSKHIPAVYLTTTPTPPPSPSTSSSLYYQLMHSTSRFSTHDAALSTSINNLESYMKKLNSDVYFSDNDIDSSQRFGHVRQHIDDNRLQDNLERIKTVPDSTTESTEQIISATATTVIATTVTPKDTNNDILTSYESLPPISTTPSVPYLTNAMKLWEKAKVLISPFTKEKVYVVTPQPRFFPQHFLYETTTESPLSTTKRQLEASYVPPFNKMPRFVVRPAPENTINAQTPTKWYSPELFGLMDLSAYVPEKPVEIIDGNSKVVTVAPPSTIYRSKDKQTLQREALTKPTMLPLPR